MLARDVAHQRNVAGDVDELLALVAFLVDVTDITRCQRPLLDGDQHRVRDPLEPLGHVRHESDVKAQLVGDFSFVDVVGQRVRNQVVRQEGHIVLRGRLGASTGVTRHTERGGQTGNVFRKRGNGNLGSSSVAPRVGDPRSRGDLLTVLKFRQPVSPVAGGVKPVISQQINNLGLTLANQVNSIDEWLAHTVGQSHHPHVDVAIFFQLLDVVNLQVGVDNLSFVVVLQLLASQLPQRHVRDLKLRVVVDELDQVLTGVPTGTNKSNFSLGFVLALSDGGVGVSQSHTGQVVEPSSLLRGREHPQFLGRRKRQTNMQSVKLLNQVQQLFGRKTVPEQNLAVLGERTFQLAEVPSQVGIVFQHNPAQLVVVLLDQVEDVVSDVVEPPRLQQQELVELGHTLAFNDNGQNFERFVTVQLERSQFQELKVQSHRKLTQLDFGVTQKRSSQQIRVAEVSERLAVDQLVPTTDQGTGPRIGEQFLLEIVDVDDGHRQRPRQMLQQVVYFLDLQLGTVLHPRFLHKIVVFFVQVDQRHLFASQTVDDTTLFVKVDDLKRFEFTSQFTGSNISVDVEQLPQRSFG